MTSLPATLIPFPQCLAGHADSILFKCDSGEEIPYSRVVELSENFSIRETCRKLVFCICENEPGALVGYLSLLYAGAVPLMLSVSIPATQLIRLMVIYRPAFVWLPQNKASEVSDATLVFSYNGYCLLSTNEKLTYSIDNSLALLLATSGSTGSPKFVRLSYENLASNANAIAQYLNIKSNDRPVTTLPPSYTFGLSIIHSHILMGSTIALTNKSFFDRGFWDFLKSEECSSFGGVPYHYDMLKKLRFTSMDLPSLRTLTQAGGRMLPEITREFAINCEERGKRFYTMYGQAEATARMAYLPPDKAVEKAGSIGVPIPGGRFWLEDELGKVQEEIEATGELVYHGRNVSMGYAESYMDLARGDERGGVLRTGDLARRDKEGFYYIAGRLKRFLKLFGHRVNLQDIEDKLNAVGYLTACSGQDDCLEIYQSQGTKESGRLIKAMLVEQLRVSPKAINIFNIEGLPRNEAGKIQYSQLVPVAGEFLA